MMSARSYLMVICCGKVVLALSSTRAEAGFVIDDFEVGSFDLAAMAPDRSDDVLQTELPSEHVVGGVRAAGIHAALGDGTVTASLDADSPNTVDDGVTLTVAPSTTLSATFSYDGGDPNELLPANFTAGDQDRFRLVLDAAPDAGTAVVFIDHSDTAQAFSPLLNLTGPGTYLFPFADFADEFGGPFEPNFNTITVVSFRLHMDGSQDPLEVTVSHFDVVPEPRTLALCLLAAAAAIPRLRNQHGGHCRLQNRP